MDDMCYGLCFWGWPTGPGTRCEEVNHPQYTRSPLALLHGDFKELERNWATKKQQTCYFPLNPGCFETGSLCHGLWNNHYLPGCSMSSPFHLNNQSYTLNGTYNPLANNPKTTRGSVVNNPFKKTCYFPGALFSWLNYLKPQYSQTLILAPNI